MIWWELGGVSGLIATSRSWHDDCANPATGLCVTQPSSWSKCCITKKKYILTRPVSFHRLRPAPPQPAPLRRGPVTVLVIPALQMMHAAVKSAAAAGSHHHGARAERVAAAAAAISAVKPPLAVVHVKRSWRPLLVRQRLGFLHDGQRASSLA